MFNGCYLAPRCEAAWVCAGVLTETTAARQATATILAEFSSFIFPLRSGTLDLFRAGSWLDAITGSMLQEGVWVK